MNGQMLIATELISILFLLVQIFSSLIRKEERTASSKILRWVMVSVILCCGADSLSIFLSNLEFTNNFLLSVVLFISYTFVAVTLFLFVDYCYIFINEKYKINKWLFKIPGFIIAADFFMLLTGALTGNIYSVKNGTITICTVLPSVSKILALVIMLYLTVIAFLRYKTIGKRSVFILGLFGVFPSIIYLFTKNTCGISLSFVAGAFSCSTVYMLMENKLSIEKISELNDKLQSRYDIIQSMSNVYFASYYIDLVNDTFLELSAKENIRDLIKVTGKAQESLFLACEKLMNPDFTDEMKEFFDLSTINERLKNKKTISHRYIGATTGWSLAYLIAGDRDENGNLLHIFYACRTIHDEKAREEAQKKKLEECNDIIANAGLGIWYIFLKDGEKPRMQPNKKMSQLLGIKHEKLSEEEVYSWWYDRIDADAIPSVERSVAEMMDNHFSENTYLWNHPEKGNIYVRCGGTSKKMEDGTCVLSGYHADVTDIVRQEELQRKAKILEENQKRITQMNVSLLGALGTVVEFRSLESGDHVKRVMLFTKILLEKLKENFPEYNLTNDQISLISRAAALHDVGKIAIPDEILKAPRKLTDEEFDEMKKHTTYGCKLLERFNFVENNEFYKYCYDICRWHHEKADGNGYPDGLKENDIPIYCQVTAVADCFDALVSKRVYKDAKSCEEAFNMIMNGECGAFSENVLKCLVLAKEDLFVTVQD